MFVTTKLSPSVLLEGNVENVYATLYSIYKVHVTKESATSVEVGKTHSNPIHSPWFFFFTTLKSKLFSHSYYLKKLSSKRLFSEEQFYYFMYILFTTDFLIKTIK